MLCEPLLTAVLLQTFLLVISVHCNWLVKTARIGHGTVRHVLALKAWPNMFSFLDCKFCHLASGVATNQKYVMFIPRFQLKSTQGYRMIEIDGAKGLLAKNYTLLLKADFCYLMSNTLTHRDSPFAWHVLVLLYDWPGPFCERMYSRVSYNCYPFKQSYFFYDVLSCFSASKAMQTGCQMRNFMQHVCTLI